MRHRILNHRSKPESHSIDRLGLSLIELLIVVVVLGLLVALFLPATRNVRPFAQQVQCRNNLKLIGLALHNYVDAYGALPPAYTVDADGNRLHSWRTLILPFLNQAPLYETIDLTKPWDDPANAAVSERRIPDYRCPSSTGLENHTHYLAVVGDETSFPGSTSRRFQEITDGLGTTWMVIEVPVERSVPWMSPQDLDVNAFLALGSQETLLHEAGFSVLFGDGTVQMDKLKLSVAERRKRVVINDERPPAAQVPEAPGSSQP